uniref:Ig-like domain-containing protein n=1 Tax=Mastacembelus armatus TaxID=205130 RepID=A0A7N8YNL8_9TELE
DARAVVLIPASVSFCGPDPEQIKAKPGENVTLQCRGSKDATTVMLRWVRPDLKSEGCVFDFRDHKINEEAQHEAFHSRVDLRDPEMKDGNFSVILKNIRISDTGSYECYVGKRKPGNLVPEPVELINSTTLKVEDSGEVELLVFCFLLLLLLVLCSIENDPDPQTRIQTHVLNKHQ